MAKPEKPSPQIAISARNMRDIVRDELYAVQGEMKHPDGLPNELIKQVAKKIVKRAIFSP
jgi:hypothetical protein